MYNLELDKVKTYDLEVNRASIAINKAKWGEISGEISNQTDLQKELDNKANKSDVYTKSEIVSGFATKAELETKANKADIPSKVSQLTNDAGYINDVSDKADKADIADMLTKTDAASTYATKDSVANMDAKVNVAINNANAAANSANTAANRVDTAIETANTAASNANAKADLANTAANNANSKASLADTAANNANMASSEALDSANSANKAATNANSKAELANTQANRAKRYADNPPSITDDGYWQIYSETDNAYIKTDTKALGESGVYVGSGDMPDNCNVQVDPSGEVLSEEELIATINRSKENEANIDAMIQNANTLGDVTINNCDFLNLPKVVG